MSFRTLPLKSVTSTYSIIYSNYELFEIFSINNFLNNNKDPFKNAELKKKKILRTIPVTMENL